MRLKTKSLFTILVIFAIIVLVIPKKAKRVVISAGIYQPIIVQKIDDNANLINSIDYSYLNKAIDDILRSHLDENAFNSIALSVDIPNLNFSYLHNPKEEFMSASTIKVPINLYIYTIALNNPDILEESIVYQYSDFEGGAGILQGSEVGSVFSVQELLSYSIIYSDNIATNMLIRTFFSDGMNLRNELTPFFGDANYENWSSSNENRMYALNYLYEHRDLYPQLIDDMIDSVYKDGIPKYIDVPVANKVGAFNATNHDFGIVFGDVDYLISISLDGFANQEELFAVISKDIFDLINSQVRNNS